MKMQREVVTVALLLLLLQHTNAQFCNTDTTATFARYEQQNPLCFQLNSTYVMYFYPEVDDFALLQVANSWSNISSSQEDLLFQIEIGGEVSPDITWYTSSNTVPFFTALIELNQGSVTSVTWDTGCQNCDDSSCNSENLCTETNTDCANGADCDLKVYVGWFGTDRDGNFVTSASRRLSNFISYSANDVYETVVAEVNENIETLT